MPVWDSFLFPLLPRPIGRRRMVCAMDAFFDESGFHASNVIAFCGVAADTPALDRFNPAWGSLLVRADLEYLEMKSALNPRRKLSSRVGAHTPKERADFLMPFVNVIREHLDIGVVVAVDVKEYQRLPKKMRSELGSVDDPIYAAFLHALLTVSGSLRDGDHLGFVCDDEESTAEPCYKMYRKAIKRSVVARKAMSSLTFANDRHYPGLQAADLLASLARREAKLKFFGETYEYESVYQAVVAEEHGKIRVNPEFWGA